MKNTDPYNQIRSINVKSLLANQKEGEQWAIAKLHSQDKNKNKS